MLGGGLFVDPAGRFLAAVAPLLEYFTLSVVIEPPVTGAALLGLDHIGTSVHTDTMRRAFRDAGLSGCAGP